MCFVVILEEISGPFIILHREFSCWCNNENSCTVLWGEMSLSEELNSWKHVCECLSRTCFGSSQYISTVENMWNSSCLNLRTSFEPKSINSLLSLLAKIKVLKSNLRKVLISLQFFFFPHTSLLPSFLNFLITFILLNHELWLLRPIRLR